MRILSAIAIVLVSGIMPLTAATAAEPAIRADVRRVFRHLDADQNGQLAGQELSGQHARLYTRLLRTADLDGDGQLVLEEFDYGLTPRRPEKIMTEKRSSRLPGADELLLLIAMMDANADGLIRREEVPERLLPFFHRLEVRLGRNEDRQIRTRQIAQAAPMLTQVAIGTVRRLELNVELEISLLPEKNWEMVQRLDRPPMRGERLADPVEGQAIFEKLDANGDGQLVFEEVPEQLADRFDRLLRMADRNRDQRISAEEYRLMTRRLQTRRGEDTMSDQPALDDEMMAP